MPKLISLLFTTSAVVFALFTLMASLVSPKIGANTSAAPYTPIEFVDPPKDTAVKTIERKLTPPPKRQTPPPTMAATVTETPGLSVNIDVPLTAVSNNSLTSLKDFSTADLAARPIVRIAPKYPASAAQQGKEGWVVLAFSIDTSGAVSNIKVLNSSPKRVFDKAATQALKKWKYRAKVVDGKAVAQHDVTVQLDFRLDLNNG